MFAKWKHNKFWFISIAFLVSAAILFSVSFQLMMVEAESSDPSIATVDQNGKVTGKAQGKVTIYANSFGGVQSSVAVTVRTKATSVTLDQTSATVTAGKFRDHPCGSIAGWQK